MNIRINEQPVSMTPPCSLAGAAQQFKPDADLLILNGFPAEPETLLQEGDQLFLIKRGSSRRPMSWRR